MFDLSLFVYKSYYNNGILWDVILEGCLKWKKVFYHIKEEERMQKSFMGLYVIVICISNFLCKRLEENQFNG